MDDNQKVYSEELNTKFGNYSIQLNSNISINTRITKWVEINFKMSNEHASKLMLELQRTNRPKGQYNNVNHRTSQHK